MKVIIAGSRTLHGTDLIQKAVRESGYDITEVVSGTARGIDQSGELWAEFYDIPVKRFPADWQRHGRGAGFIRNEEMANYADALIAVWDGISRGTKHMINMATRKGLKVSVYRAGSLDHFLEEIIEWP